MKQTFKNALISIFILLSSAMSAQETISGTITDENGVPLPGATIVVVETNDGTTTDFDGNYSINASEGQTILLSYVGYETLTLKVSDDSNFDISLKQSGALDEIVVTALGISREKKSLGYSVTEVDGDNVNTIKDNNLASSLTGKVAGLQVSAAGSLGSGSRITIRGNSSLSGNSQALIVVDGMPINASLPLSNDGGQREAGSNNGGGQPSFEPSIAGGGISDINPDDVESISVLKGPAASALYGSRAGNGVILVTTKKGSSSDRLGVTLKTNLYVDNPMFLPDFQNLYGQGTLSAPNLARSAGSWSDRSWGGKLDGSQQPYYDGTTKAYSAQSNNVEDFFRSGVRAITSLSLDKRSEAGSVRFSYTNNSSESIVEGSDLNSHNFNLRGVANLSDKLTIDAKATYFTQEVLGRASTVGAQGLIGNLYEIPRNVAIDDMRNYQMANPGTPSEFRVITYGDGLRGNPFWQSQHDYSSVRRNRFLAYTKINYEFTDWLSAFVRIGADVTNVRDNEIKKPGHHNLNDGSMILQESQFGELNSEFLLTAKYEFTDKLNAVANLGGNLSRRSSEGMMIFGSDFKIPTKFFVANLNTVNAPVEAPLAIKKVNSAYGSVNLGYDNFLYLDGSVRNDWSSTLSEDNRSYTYSSVSLSAILNRYIDPEQNFFNLVKLRASLAQVGNDTDPYQLIQTYNVPGQGYRGLTTLSNSPVKFNPDLKPETVTSSEFGLELSMLSNKLTLDLTVYDIETKDLIFDVPVAASTGYTFNRSNIGLVSNKGLEIALGADLIDINNFSWNTSLFYSANKNKVEELVDGLDNFTYNTSSDNNIAVKATVGGSIGDIYGRILTGETDASGIPTASAAPTELLGNAQPDFLAGWSNTIRYKDFSMSFLIDARIGGQIYSQTSAGLDRAGVSKRSLQYRDGVTVSGNNTATGAPNTESISGEEYWTAMSNVSGEYIYDQDNVRLRELSIGYNVPGVDIIGLQSANIQLVGRNLFFLSKSADDIDPEAMLGTSIGVQGMSHYAMPTLTSLGLNVTLNF
ncbi:MAG: SusC/RagA family TonB-linked outer membrane protein [Flavobacteriaceae bacterium]